MFRKLMLTTAIVALTAGGAMAQAQPAQSDPGTAATPANPAPTQVAPTVTEITVGKGQLAANLIGETVYNGPGETAEQIGDVNDLVIGADGKVSQLIVGVGGFLGIGEKDVAVDYAKAKVADRAGERWLVVQMSKEELEAAPAFDRAPFMPAAETAMSAPMSPAPSAIPTDTQSTGSIDKSTLTPVPQAELSSDKLKGTTVYGVDDANIGEIGDVVVTTDGKVDAVVLDVGGFLGIGEKQVAVGMDNLAFMTDKDGNRYLYTTFTKEQLEAQPAFDPASFASNRDQQLLKMTR